MKSLEELQQENEELKTKLALALTYLDDKTARAILFGDTEKIQNGNIYTNRK